MGKSKNTELNFLYMDEKYQEKSKKKKPNIKKNIRAEKFLNSAQDNMFNFDNEIVIGVTKVPSKIRIGKANKKEREKQNKKIEKEKIRQEKVKKEEIKRINQNRIRKEKNETKNSKVQITAPYETMQVKVIQEPTVEQGKTKKKVRNNVRAGIVSTKDKRKRQIGYEQKKNNIELNQEKKINKKINIVKAIIKWTSLVSALIATLIFFMMSPIFDLKQVQVVNNEKLSNDTIISLSRITIGENIYKINSKQAEKNIKQNAYIESVKLNRKLPDKILITVKERKANFILEYANSYVYINNQGYILEISETKPKLSIIEGYITNLDEIKVGSRLQEDDLEKLMVVLKIIESATGNGIDNLITKINIQDKQNYTLELESEKKIVYLGDASNLSNRMLYLKAVLEEEKGIEGEIFINGDLNKTTVYFRKKE